ncbi:MAG TPA: hypothetical protein VIV65_00730, partial [Gemmatimonadaceae bacterium]
MRRQLLLLLYATGLSGQGPIQPATPVFSMGQPPQWLPYAEAFGVSGSLARPFGVLIGVDRPILNPVTGLLTASAEAYETWHGDDGLRVIANAPALGIGIGGVWNITGSRTDAIVTFRSAVRRGGILGHGSMVRLDWLPTRERTFALGVQLPLLQPFAGRTRPKSSSVRIQAGGSMAPSVGGLEVPASQAFDEVAARADVIGAYTSLYSDADQAMLTAGRRESYQSAIAGYHASLSRAFALAIGDSTRGARILAHARDAVLDDVILPCDVRFGQVKRDGIESALGVASQRFARWLADSSALTGNARAGAGAAFRRWLAILDDTYSTSLDAWKDSRLVWIPLQLALTPDRYDEQAEVDSLIGRAVGHPFTGDNVTAYLRTADLPVEIARSILAARRYHVLWTHDFTGRLVNRQLDGISYAMVADAYLPALTAAVRRYDSTGVMPQYMILLDAFYYHARDGALWMNILENPLGASVRLRGDESAQASHLESRLDTLRAAVAASKRLQREASERGGQRWLSSVVKVHVNVVQPSDFSFRSAQTVPPLPFTPDNIVRDHRKLVITDLTETNPYDGELLVTGIGVGEHYASATWEDRGYRLRGPAALEARAAIRRALASNGFRPDQIPVPLRATEGTVV